MKRILFSLLALLFAYGAGAQCVTNFSTAMSPSGNNLLRVAFTITGTPTPPAGKIAHYSINWGDASSATVGAGTYYHNYAAVGTYTPVLVMNIIDSNTSALYCTDTETHSFSVYYMPCATSISATVGTGFSVTVTATTPAGGSPNYTWVWGDATPNSTGNPATHTYATSGNKTILLYIVSTVGGGCTTSTSIVVSIPPGPVACSTLHSYFNDTATTGLTRHFFNYSTVAAGTYRTFTYYFGDSYTSTNQSPAHTYATAGTYTACLVTRWYDSVTTTLLCTDSFCRTINATNPAPPVNRIYGYILQDSNSSAPHISNPIYKVWLIKYDSTTHILSAVDSLLDTGTIYQYTAYQFMNEAAGTYRVKAKLMNGPTTGASYVPTYHLHSTMWYSATTFTHTGGTTGAKMINMIAGMATSGPGFVGGNVSAGANKGTSGNGIPDMTILLLDANNDLIEATYTDANGDYSFASLPTAAYSVYPEDMGFTTTPIGLVIDGNQPSVTGLNFSRSQSQMTITPGSTGIIDINKTTQYVIYPNPAHNEVTIAWNTATKATANIVVTDITGKVVNRTSMTGTGRNEIVLQQLQKGMYFVTLEINGSKQTQKLIME